MLVFYSYHVRAAVRRLEEACGRKIAGDTILKIVKRHPRPRRFAELLIRVFDAEAKRAWLTPGHYDAEVKTVLGFDPEDIDHLTAALGVAFPSTAFKGYDPIFVEEATRGLKEQGFAKFESRVSDEDLAEIEKALSSPELTFIERTTKRVHNGYTPENVANSTSNVVEISNQDLIGRVPAVRKLAFDPSILESVQRYFGTTPILVQTNAWWSTPHSMTDEAKRNAAQMFHQDREFIKFVKCFVYLNDVTDVNGPHEYISGSLQDYPLVVPERYQVSNRLEDDYLKERYAEDRFVTMTGPRGTIILEDTAGFHKGVPLISGHRILLQFEYAVSLYCSPVERFDPAILDSRDMELARASRLFANYG